ncbi:MAG TPA: cobalamin-dependent protein [Longimicrobiales bacterium]|nr:cobalamin-dependent protein [Longimicrobiales bacterium]
MTDGRALAGAILARRDDIAARVTEEFLQNHPDWLTRYGDAARTRGVEDARFHIDFLAGAVQSGGEAAFRNYATWTARVLGSRGIDPDFLIENLAGIGAEFASSFDGDDTASIDRLIAAACQAVRERDAEASPAPAGMDTDLRLYLDAILGGHRTAALNVALELLRDGLSVPDVYTELLQAAQYEVGRLWEENRISVSTEHMATAITQYVVAQLYSRMEIPDSTRGNAIVTGVEGELHQLGANMVADVLEADGWNVRFLGTQLPHRDVLQAIDAHEPALVGISTTMLFNMPNVARLVEDVRRHAPGELQIIVGGGAFRPRADMWRDIGANGFARDLRDTVTLVRGLYTSPRE